MTEESLIEGMGIAFESGTKSFVNNLMKELLSSFVDVTKQFVRIYEHPFEVRKELLELGYENPVSSIGKLTVDWLSQDRLTRIQVDFFEEEFECFYDRDKLVGAVTEEYCEERQYTHEFRDRYEAIRWGVKTGTEIESMVHRYLLSPEKVKPEEDPIPF